MIDKTPSASCVLGVIGGTGLEKNIGGQPILDNKETTQDFDRYPWGIPSTPLAIQSFTSNSNRPVGLMVLCRHGAQHQFSPSDVPYRANLAALKQHGATHILAFCAVGAVSRTLPAGSLVFIEQYVDLTSPAKRDKTFFNEGTILAHTNLLHPTCKSFRQLVEDAASECPDIPKPRSNTCCVCIEGPRFSTEAELDFYERSMKAEVVGMTTAVEASLARELGLHYCNIGLVTDSREDSTHLSLQLITQMMKKHEADVATLVRKVLEKVADHPALSCECEASVKGQVLYQSDAIVKQSPLKYSIFNF